MKNQKIIPTNHWMENDNIRSPYSGLPMILQKQLKSFDYKGKSIEIEHQSWFCSESGEYFTTTYLDTINVQKVYRGYDKLFVNTLVLCEFKVYRLVDIVEKEYDDFYELDPFMGSKMEYHSVLTGFIPLILHLKSDEYNNLVKRWNFNNTNKVDDYEIEIKKHEQKTCSKHSL